MLQNAYLLAKIGDTAENERNFAEDLPKIGNYPAGSSTMWPTCPHATPPPGTWRGGLGPQGQLITHPDHRKAMQSR